MKKTTISLNEVFKLINAALNSIELNLKSPKHRNIHDMSKTLLSLIKPLNSKTKPSNYNNKFITLHIKKLANEVCDILRTTNNTHLEETIKTRFLYEDIAPSDIAHQVFDKIRDCELGLKFFNFITQNKFSLDGFAYSSLLKLLARYKLFPVIDNVLCECLRFDGKRPTREALDTVICAYVESGLVSKALELYLFQLESYNVLPCVVACNCLLNGLVENANVEAAWRVYNEMVKRDDGMDNVCVDNYSVCTMVKALCKDGKVEKGKRLIEKRWGKNCIPNVVFYNTLIDGYCKRGDVNSAYGLFVELMARGFLPTPETYGAIINGFCKRGNFKKVDIILKQIELTGTRINVQVYNTVIDAKYKHGFVAEAVKTTRKMIEDGHELDIVTYNTLISNMCRDGKVQAAEQLLKDILNRGVNPTERTFTPLIHAYCRERNFDRASSLMVEMTEFGHKPDLITYSGLIHGLVADGEVDASLTIRNKLIERGLHPDACIYNVLMNGLCKKGRLNDAKQLLVEMLDRNVIPDEYVYATLIDGYIRSGNFNEAEKLFDFIISSGVSFGLVLYNAMIKGYCKNGMMKDVIICVNKMAKRKISPDEYTYSTIIDGFIKQNDLHSALTMFSSMIKHNCTPNVVTYTSLISGFCRNGDTIGAKKTFEEMLANGISPNVVTYTVLIGGFCKVGNLAKAALFFEEMLMRKCRPNDITYHYLVKGLSNNTERALFRKNSESDQNVSMLLDIHGRMLSDGLHPIAAAYISITACLGLRRMLETALELTRKLLSKGLPLNHSATLAALLQGVCLEGKYEEWRNVVPSELSELNPGVVLKYLSIFSHYSSHDATERATLVLHTMLKEHESDQCELNAVEAFMGSGK